MTGGVPPGHVEGKEHAREHDYTFGQAMLTLQREHWPFAFAVATRQHAFDPDYQSAGISPVEQVPAAVSS